MASGSNVDVGFPEKTESWKLLSHLFPSKIGGKPAWLSLRPVPDADDLKCSVCSHPCVFLLQLYAPLEDNTESFHKTLFVFICRNPECCKSCDNGNFVVLRSDLSRKNDFYSYDPPDYDNHDTSAKNPSASDFQPLCTVCGCSGTKNCSNCKAPYCSRSHQILDWKRHKSTCKHPELSESLAENANLFPEHGIVIDADDTHSDDDDDNEGVDDDDDNDDDDGADDDVERRMKEFKEVAGKSEFSTQELEQMAFTETDKSFEKFKKVVERNPDQVIRHSRGGEPLWITDENQLKSSDVPNCQYCGAERNFEFQVMPQLVAELGVDNLKQSIDWGVLVIYTCSKSCSGSEPNYRREFLYKQDIQLKKK